MDPHLAILMARKFYNMGKNHAHLEKHFLTSNDVCDILGSSVNLALALEIYFKIAIHLQSGGYPRTHRLLDLLNKLECEHRVRIEEGWKAEHRLKGIYQLNLVTKKNDNDKIDHKDNVAGEEVFDIDDVYSIMGFIENSFTDARYIFSILDEQNDKDVFISNGLLAYCCKCMDEIITNILNGSNAYRAP